MLDKILEKSFTVLLQNVPVEEPSFIVGEDKNIVHFERLLAVTKTKPKFFSGALVVGDIGRGKTHFFKYLRASKKDEFQFYYVPEMVQTGSFGNALISIYRDIFSSSYQNTSIFDISQEIETYIKDTEKKKSNFVLELVVKAYEIDSKLYNLCLSFFSGKLLTPDDFKKLKQDLGIKNNDFFSPQTILKTLVGSIEAISIIRGRPYILMLDELDRLYSSGSTWYTQKVGDRLLDFYRSLFNELSSLSVSGLLIIGATHDILARIEKNQAFFTRLSGVRFDLNPPATLTNCLEYLLLKSEEENSRYTEQEIEFLAAIIQKQNLFKANSWRDFNLNLYHQIQSGVDVEEAMELSSEDLILSILAKSKGPMTSDDIINAHDEAKSRFKKGLPAKTMNRMLEAGVVEKVKKGNKIAYKYLGVQE